MIPQYYVEYLCLMQGLCYRTPSRVVNASPLVDDPALSHCTNSGCLSIHLKCSSVLFTKVVSVLARKKNNSALYFPSSFFASFLSFLFSFSVDDIY